jgi:hypothetical protein
MYTIYVLIVMNSSLIHSINFYKSEECESAAKTIYSQMAAGKVATAFCISKTIPNSKFIVAF